MSKPYKQGHHRLVCEQEFPAEGSHTACLHSGNVASMRLHCATSTIIFHPVVDLDGSISPVKQISICYSLKLNTQYGQAIMNNEENQYAVESLCCPLNHYPPKQYSLISSQDVYKRSQDDATQVAPQLLVLASSWGVDAQHTDVLDLVVKVGWSLRRR